MTARLFILPFLCAPLLALCPPRAGEEPKPFEQRLEGTTATLKLVPIPGGVVEIGEGDQKRAVEVRPFYMATTETTWDLYDLFVYRLDEDDPGLTDKGADAVTRPSKPYIPPDRGFGHAGYPAISMTHKGAQDFCKWLSRRTGRTYRLPTEAEWQHAAGAEPPELGDHAWYKANAGPKTHPVGTKAPSARGLHDVRGNVAEWCNGLDGTPVARGGSYLDPAEGVSAAARQLQTSDWNMSDPQFPKSSWWLADCTHVGFRVVCEIESKPESKPEPKKEGIGHGKW
jgi:formylglycine-generating enzyme required for sulfatase activity